MVLRAGLYDIFSVRSVGCEPISVASTYVCRVSMRVKQLSVASSRTPRFVFVGIARRESSCKASTSTYFEAEKPQDTCIASNLKTSTRSTLQQRSGHVGASGIRARARGRGRERPENSSCWMHTGVFWQRRTRNASRDRN